jgi:hypothetical protein
MYKVDTEKKDRQTLKDLMNKEHDEVNLEQFCFASIALLDIIDTHADNKDKERLAAIAEKLTEPDLENLQTKIDTAIFELGNPDNTFRGTPTQQAFVNARKGNLDLTKLVSRKADNKLLTNYLIGTKKMPVSNELKRNLHANGHDDLLNLIKKLQDNEKQEQNNIASHLEEKKVKTKTLSLKM